ncbi:MAG6450 family protein [Lacticaseibacillus suihuaensis]
MTIDHQLENRYQFKDLKPPALRAFNQFLAATVGKRLTITQVDALYLRTKGPHGGRMTERVAEQTVTMLHYGPGRAAFRLFGYYNMDGYFVIHRLDPADQFHRE